MLIQRPLKILGSVVTGLLLIALGFSIFLARVALFPPWYRAEAVGHKLPECSSYQSRVYVYCHDPRRSLGVEFTEFESERVVEGKTIRVSGWWVWPDPARTPLGVVVLVHGGGADRRAMLKHAKYLSAAGYHSLLIDCHNHGLNHNDHTGISFGLWESESVIAAAEWAATHVRQLGPKGEMLPLPIAVMGTSQGAFAALRAAANSDVIRAVVAENPYVSVRRILLEYPFASWLPRIAREGALVLVSGWLHHSIWSLDVRDFADRIGSRPVLLIHGENDAVTPLSHSEQILAALEGPKELWRVPGGEHEFLVNVMGKQYEQKVLGFLRERLTLAK